MGRLRLVVHAEDDDDDVRGWRRSLEGPFLQALLDACEDAVHARLGPQALLCVRSLRVHWRLDEAEVARLAVARRLGAELAQSVLTTPTVPWRAPEPEAPAVVFAQDLDRDLVLAAELSKGAPGWYHRLPHADRPVTARVRDTPHLARDVVERLAALELARPVLAHEGEGLVRALAAQWPAPRWPASVWVAAAQAGGRHRGLLQTPSAGGSPAREAPRTGPEPGRAPSPPAGSSADAAGAPNLRPARAAVAPAVRAWSVAGASSARVRPPDPPNHVGGPHDPAGGGPPPSERQHAANDPARFAVGSDPLTEEQPAPPLLPAVDTDWAGVFYLVGPILELDLAEHLWCAGFREGEVLALVVRTLIDDHADLAPALLGGTGSETPTWPEVEAWAVEEVARKVAASLDVALRRRVGASPGVPSLRARLQAWRPDAWPAAASSLQRRLVGACAAALAHVFEARLARVGDVAMPLWTYWRLSGQVLLPAEGLVVRMSAEAIDLQIRLAGLDQNPGWAPWLHRQVELVFDVDEV